MADPEVAVILGGGGVHGAFEVGALEFLFAQGIRADLFCAASVGSLNAAKIATVDRASQPDVLVSLKGFWLDLRVASDMYVEQAWFAHLSEHAKWLYYRLTAPPRSVGSFVFFQIFAPALIVDTYADMFSTVSDVKALINDLEAGAKQPALLDPTPIFNRLTDPSFIDPKAIAHNPDVRLFIAVTQLDDGNLYYVDGAGTVFDEDLKNVFELDGTTLKTVDFISAVKASASLPIAFPPIALAGATYTDGGVRQNNPVEPAARLNAKRVYAIGTSKAGVGQKSFASPNMLDVDLRVIDLELAEIARAAFSHPPTGWQFEKITIVQPSIDLPLNVLVEPGLISIYMAYGSMRAADANAPGGGTPIITDLYRETDAVITSRLAAWSAEFYANVQDLPTPVELPKAIPTGTGLQRVPSLIGYMAVRDRKREVFRSVASRAAAGGDFPVGLSDWWTKWERHSWTPLSATPWDSVWFRDGKKAEHETPPALQMNVTVQSSGSDIYVGDTVDVTVVVVDAAVNAPVVRATVSADGMVSPANVPFSFRVNEPVTELTVSAPYYPPVVAQLRAHAPTLTATATYDPPQEKAPVDQPVEVVVHAEDLHTGRKFGAADGHVHIENPPGTDPSSVDVDLETQFAWTFRTVTRTTTDSDGVQTVTTTSTTGEVAGVEGYARADVDFGLPSGTSVDCDALNELSDRLEADISDAQDQLDGADPREKARLMGIIRAGQLKVERLQARGRASGCL